MKLVCKKEILYNWARQTNKPDQLAEYCHIKKMTEYALKHAQWEYLRSTLTDALGDGNTNPSGRYIKCLRKDSVGVALIKSGGILHLDP